MNLSEFEQKYNGKPLDFDGVYGDQCVDLFEYYNRDVIKAPVVYGNAIDIPHNAPKNFYTWVDNTPSGVPPAGAVVIWGKPYGRYIDQGGSVQYAGHIAIFLHGDANNFVSLDQNFPEGSYVHEQGHTYDGVLGWLIPQTTTTPDDPLVCDPKSVRDMVIGKAAKYNDFVALGYNEATDVTTKIKVLNDQVDGTTKQLGDLQKQNEGLLVEVQQTKDALAKQADITSEQANSHAAAADVGITATADLKNLKLDLAGIAEQLQITPTLSDIAQAITTLQNDLKACELEQLQTAKKSQTIFQWLTNIFAGKKVK